MIFVVGCASPDATSTAPSQLPIFAYPIRVQAKSSGLNISRAKVTIEVGGQPPIDDVTDNNGYGELLLPANYVDKSGKLRVEADGYQPFLQTVQLTKGLLPDVIQLDQVIGNTQPGSATNTPTTTNTPALSSPDGTSALTSTMVPTATPSVSGDLTNPTVELTDKCQIGTILFVSQRAQGKEIYKMNYDGSNVTQITNNADDDALPRVSSDGTRVVYVSIENGQSDLYLMNIDGTATERITEQTGDDPSWSPAGNQIVFSSAKDGDWEIYILDLSTKELTQLTNNNHADNRPHWSPDGSKIAYDSRPSGENWGIHVIDVNGLNDVEVLNEKWAGGPVWSPDGSSLAYASAESGNGEIYTINLETKVQTRLTNDKLKDVDPWWSPDGECIIFESNRSGNGEIWLMDKNGNLIRNLTNNPANDYFASWSK